MNKKIIIIVLFVFASFFTLIYDVNADYQVKVVSTTPCQLYKDQKGKNATGSCIYSNTSFNALTVGPYWVDVGDQLKVITSKPSIKAPTSGYGSECKSEFAYISIDYGSKTYNGYVCKDNLWDGVITDAMKKEFKNAGFPESYYSYLALLRTAHPNWKFLAVNTGLDFKTAVANEDSGSKSLIQYTSSVNALGYLSTSEVNYNWTTDKYKLYAGSNWYAANKETIAYYMDPRNFLTDNYIWQFEGLSFDETTQTSDVVKSMLNGQYIEKYATNFVNAGKKANVNPVYLASLSKQEVGGTSANIAISGKQITYGGKVYSGYYNFYNIGATPTNDKGVVDGLDAYRGIVYAAGGADGKATTYSRPWNTIDKALYGGALFTSEKYISFGQITSYLKKWDVVSNFAKENNYKVSGDYSNQYMQNIQAPRSEANSTFKSYSNLNMIDKSFTFYIPVYNNMPASTSLPNKNSPNNYLKNLTINIDGSGAKTINGFNGANVEYTINVDATKVSAVIEATSVRSDATISGTGNKTLKTGTNVIPIKVVAANGNVRVYTITINKAAPAGDYKKVDQIIKETKINVDDKYITGLTYTTKASSFETLVTSSEAKAKVVIKRGNKVLSNENVVTGDTISITSGSETKNYTIVLYGDINKDGKISILDLLAEQKHLLVTNKLSGTEAKAADVNKDGKISILDLLSIQKHLLGYNLISQK